MAKNKKKKGNRPQIENDFYENKDRTQKEYAQRRGHDGHQQRAAKPDPHPVAKLMCDTFSEQIRNFLAADTKQRKKFMDDLFAVKNYPSQLQGCDGAEDYSAYLLERTVRENKRDPEKLTRMSMSMVLLNRTTGRPAFFITCFIAPNESGGVTVYEQGENGTEYAKTLRWNSNS